ncbi:phosphatase PAP2 family protein [Peptoniphilus equinus]|uniref:Phosphatase PAP2 family protein n=1 Tax=Peptoniphilus equinus TaxID=3016343 RepID=A0ABY7QVF4_9FIRM|nr:phosphatase PAP2 family protein [Peptoniphilus equinus]WBW49888.1 phosphatase PAP2 family protein [Peptoniphilus equinus]
MAWEISLLNEIQGFENPVFDIVAKMLAQFGTAGIGFIIIGLGLAVVKRTRRWGLHILAGLILVFIFGNVLIKPLVGRVRPYVEAGKTIIVPALQDGSFPSGHTYSAFVTAFASRRYHRLWGGVLMTFAVLMGLSRLYLYVHYPTDVLGGVVLGLVASLLAGKLIEQWYRRRHNNNA